MVQLIAVALFALSSYAQTLPCGQFDVQTQWVGSGYQLVINGCPSELASLGTTAELQAIFPDELQAQNHFLFLFGRLRGYQVTALPNAI